MTDQQTAVAGNPASRLDAGAPSGRPATALPYTCKAGSRCAVYQAITVEAAVEGVHRITFHGTHVATFAPFEAAVMVMGLHAGAHMEAQRWRWQHFG